MTSGSSDDTAWWTLEAGQVFADVASGARGLSEAEAAARLASSGPNRLFAAERANPLRILAHQFTSPLIYVLLVAMVVSLGIAWFEDAASHAYDAIVIGIVLVLNAAIGFFQEYRAENAIAALVRLVAPRATVVRGGQRISIDSQELVSGDVVLLESGDLVPADLRLVDTIHFECDEALLTGESLPSVKGAAPIAGDYALPLGDRRNMAFMGTTVTTGRGRGVVVATGTGTQIGRIATEIRGTERAETPLQSRMRRFGARISLAILAASTAAFLVGWLRGEELAEMFLTAVAIAVSAIPEGLPVVMTIALAVSVRRMARRNAIVRRLPAVETVGSCTVIVTDKTGTLTQNQMTVQRTFAGGACFDVTGTGLALEGRIELEGRPAAVEPGSPLRETLLAGMLCNESDLRRTDGTYAARGDPTEVALLVAAVKGGLDREALLEQHRLVDAIPFEPENQYAASVHERDGHELVYLKGAPERVVTMCDRQLDADGRECPIDREAALEAASGLAADGLRVLAMAVGDGHDEVAAVRAEEPRDLTLVGLVGMLDPPREDAADAIEACRQAGIHVVMVTGDHEQTAVAIAERLGLGGDGGGVMGGQELASLSDAELDRALGTTTVFARVSPSDKLRIVERLKQQGEIITVTGDGVNDAPALKSAHVGAAMGLSGTDVAKEASEIVLTDDNFASVAAAVHEGRNAFSNLRKATIFLVSSGVAELLAIVGSLAANLPLPFLPAQILWLNVVTNGIEDVGLAFEPGEPDEFRRPPRDPREGILPRMLLERTLVAGVVMAAGTLGLFLYEWGGQEERLAYARVAALTTMVAFQLFHVGNCRSERASAFARSPFSNRFLFVGVAVTALVHVAAMYLPFTRTLLRLQPLDVATWVRIAAVAVTIVVAMELHKLVRRQG